MSGQTVIRVVRKKNVHGEESHGGSWKVAYADFVTAMMAFFLVMWIISMDQPVKEDIQNYFNNPFSTSQSKAGISKLASGGESPFAMGPRGGTNVKNWRELALEAQKDKFQKAQEAIQSELLKKPELQRLRQHVEMSITDAGLVIELVESSGPTFFDSGSANLPPAARDVLALIARQLGRLPNRISIEGHTDTVPYGPGATYTNWELSADRANAARRLLVANGVRPSRIWEVCGYADSRLRFEKEPTNPGNRRVSIRVNYAEVPADGPGVHIGPPASGSPGATFGTGIAPMGPGPAAP